MKKRKSDKMIVLGITGSFGSGKTTVAKMFKKFAAKVLDADEIAHWVMRTGSPAYKKILALLGKDVLAKDKSINRRKLGRLVFKDRILLGRLNRIIHPEVIRIMQDETKKAGRGLVVWDVPLLFEARMQGRVDKIIVVRANHRVQVKRLMQNRYFKRGDILRRIKSQIPLKDKVRQADFVIDNSTTRLNTKRQVEEIWRKI